MHAILALAALGSGAWNAETLEWRATDWGKRGAERAWLVVKPYAASRRAGAREELDLAVGDTVMILNAEVGVNTEVRGWVYGEKTVVGDAAGVASASLRTVRGYFPVANVVLVPELPAPTLKLVPHRSDLSSWRQWTGSAVAKQLVKLVQLILQYNAEAVTVTPFQARRCGCTEVPRLDSITKIGLACRAKMPPQSKNSASGRLIFHLAAECAAVSGVVCQTTRMSAKGVPQNLGYLVLFCPPGFVRTCSDGCVLDAEGTVPGYAFNERALQTIVAYVIDRFGARAFGDWNLGDAATRSASAAAAANTATKRAAKSSNRVSARELERLRRIAPDVLSTDTSEGLRGGAARGGSQVWRDIAFTGTRGAGRPVLQCSASNTLAASARARLCGVVDADVARAFDRAHAPRDASDVAAAESAARAAPNASAGVCSADLPLPACPPTYTVTCPSDHGDGVRATGAWGCLPPLDAFATRRRKREHLVRILKRIARETYAPPMNDADAAVSGLPSIGNEKPGWHVSAYKAMSWDREHPMLVRDGLTCRFGARLSTVVRGAAHGFGPRLREDLAAVLRVAQRGIATHREKERENRKHSGASHERKLQERHGWVNIYRHDMINEYSNTGPGQVAARLYHSHDSLELLTAYELMNSTATAATILAARDAARRAVLRGMASLPPPQQVTGDWAPISIGLWRQRKTPKASQKAQRRRMEKHPGQYAMVEHIDAPRWPPHTELPIGLVTQVVNLNEKRAFDRLTFRRAADSTAKDRVRYRLEPGESVIFSSGAENAYMVEGDAESENLVLFVRWKRPGTRGQSNRNIAYRSTLGQLRKGAGTSQI